jgi:CRISPR-associated protein Cas2
VTIFGSRFWVLGSSRGNMFTLISYDIVEDKRRTKVMKYLLGYGARVQYSVFECDLTDQQFAKVQHDLARLVDRQTDSVRCYQLDVGAVKQIKIIGVGQVTILPPYYLVG